MGRETFLVPVIWEEGGRYWLDERFFWPVCSPETGRVEKSYPVPFDGTKLPENKVFMDDFNSDELGLQWNFRRLPKEGMYSLAARKGLLRLYLDPETISPRKRYGFMGILQTETDFEYSASMEFRPEQTGAEGGKYAYCYSLDGGKRFLQFAAGPSDLILCRGYSGARLGIYATSNGDRVGEFADFDSVCYRGTCGK